MNCSNFHFGFQDRHQREAPEEPVVPGPHPFQRQESSVSTLGIENPNVKQGPILPLNELQVPRAL